MFSLSSLPDICEGKSRRLEELEEAETFSLVDFRVASWKYNLIIFYFVHVSSLSSLRPDICEGKARRLKELEEAEN